MKINKILTVSLVALFGVTLTGCGDFLDTMPRETKESSKLYTNQDGYKVSLNGAYLMLADTKVFGKNATMYLPEILARHWFISEDDKTNELYTTSNYDFANFKGNGTISALWTGYYKTVAQLNDLLDNMRNTGVPFTGDLKQIIEGEAYGLRGFLHLEALRMWGPIPSQADAGTDAVPYVTDVSTDPNTLVSENFKTVVEGIISDLDRAEALLKETDPILEYPLLELNIANTEIDPWLLYRQNSFNYYAVLAAKARLYNWLSTNPAYSSTAPELAVKYAKLVIEGRNSLTDETQFELTTSLSLFKDGLVFYNECLFAIHNPKMSDYIKGLFVNEKPLLSQTKETMDTAYEIGRGGDQDVRYKNYMWRERTYTGGIRTYHFYKYGGNPDFENIMAYEFVKNTAPVLRLAEMYLILVERLPLAGTDNANEWFEKFRNARSMDANFDYSMTTEEQRRDRLEKEYRKEFFGEGQMFYFYKRFKYESFSWPSGFSLPNGLNSYLIPMPKQQQSFEK